MEKVLVTGGGGFIGKALVQELVKRRVAVAVVGRNHYPELAALGVQCHQGDIRDLAFLERVLADRDTVFHVAAKAGIWGPREDYYSINVTGTTNVIAACRSQGVRHLVYTSTPSVVFDQNNLEGVDEATPYATRPLCHYAASKIRAEKEVLRAQSNNLNTIAIRPHLVWGPGDTNLVPRLLERGKSKTLKIVGSGANRVDIAYIDNVVHAHILAADNLWSSGSGAGQAFFIGQEESVNLWQWINELFARMGIPPVTRRVPFVAAYCAGLGLELMHTLLKSQGEPKMTRFVANQLAKSHWFSHAKAINILGYRQLVATGKGMDILIDWLKGCKA
jgi:nucleoside-diphosphate-sugar epimerase